MTPKSKAPTTAETIKEIQQNRLAYGADKRARYVEHVCGLLLNDRFGPWASDDMFTIEDHTPEVTELLSYEVTDGVSTTCGSGWGFHGDCKLWDASVRTGSRSDRTISPHLQLLGHLNQSNAPPNGALHFLGHIALHVSSPHVSKGPPSEKGSLGRITLAAIRQSGRRVYPRKLWSPNQPAGASRPS